MKYLWGTQSYLHLMGKISSIFDDMYLLRVSKFISMNFSLHFWNFLSSLSVSHEFMDPQMRPTNTNCFWKMSKFTKIIKNKKIFTFIKIPSTDLLRSIWSSFHINFIKIKPFFMKIWNFEAGSKMFFLNCKNPKNSVFRRNLDIKWCFSALWQL